jgi:hypothetical protein
MTDEFSDLHQLREHLTLLVHDWMFLGHEGGVDNPELAELMAIVRGRQGILPLDEAAKRVEIEFNDWNTYGHPLFGSFRQELADEVLRLVDWRSIVNAMRTRED